MIEKEKQHLRWLWIVCYVAFIAHTEHPPGVCVCVHNVYNCNAIDGVLVYVQNLCLWSEMPKKQRALKNSHSNAMAESNALCRINNTAGAGSVWVHLFLVCIIK